MQDKESQAQKNVERESIIWTEKYRPQDFSEVRGQEVITKRIKAMVEQNNVPNLLFAGPPGVGKTSLALIIAKTLFGKGWRENTLEMNASDERGIDTIRSTIKDFARTKPIGNAPFKFCILDEADALTKEAQHALRRTMELFTRTCRLCLIANYSSKLIEPIQSRCAVFRFKPLPKEAVEESILGIAGKEGLVITSEKIMNILFDVSEGDVRKMENILQSCAVLSKNINEDMIYEIVSSARPKEIRKLLELATAGDFVGARELLLEVMLKHGLSGL